MRAKWLNVLAHVLGIKGTDDSLRLGLYITVEDGGIVSEAIPYIVRHGGGVPGNKRQTWHCCRDTQGLCRTLRALDEVRWKAVRQPLEKRSVAVESAGEILLVS